MIKKGAIVQIKAQNGMPTGDFYKVIKIRKNHVCMKRIQNGFIVENEDYTCSHDKLYVHSTGTTCIPLSSYKRICCQKHTPRLTMQVCRATDKILGSDAHILSFRTSYKVPTVYVRYEYATRTLSHVNKGRITELKQLIRFNNITLL